MLVAEPFARPAAARLDLVEGEDEIALVADPPQPLEEARRGGDNAPLAEDRLDEDPAGVVVDELRHRIEIAVGGVLEAGKHRPQALVVFRLGGGGDGAERAAVEAAAEGDDLVLHAVGAEANELDRRLVGLGAGIAEERLSAEAPLGEEPGPFPLGLGVPGVGDMDQPRDLLLHCLDDRRRAMAEEVAAPAREEIEILTPLGIPDLRSHAAFEADREPPVIGDDVAVEGVDHRLRGGTVSLDGGHTGLLNWGDWSRRNKTGVVGTRRAKEGGSDAFGRGPTRRSPRGSRRRGRRRGRARCRRRWWCRSPAGANGGDGRR